MKRSKFNLSHTQLLTARMGQLIPIGLVEVLPGDTFQHAAQALVRAAPLAVPPMHPVRIDVRHFFVPNRLVFVDWEDFITGGPDGTDNSVLPYRTQEVAVGSTLDYLGVPPGEAPITFNAMPLRALGLIWNEYYRDQDLQDPVQVEDTPGLDATTYDGIYHVNWEKDYFTTARPFEQKGPAVTLPLGTSAPLTGTALINEGGPQSNTSLKYGLVRGEADSSGHATVDMLTGTMSVGDPINLYGALDGVVDLSSATAATVNDLRLALALQRYAEARARYGSRYTEYLRYLGVRSSDARLQRPEYLGGSRSSLQFSEVLSTSTANNAIGEPVDYPGQFGGHGIGANRTNRYRKFFEEHGFVISVMSVIPQTMYPQGLFRHWNRLTRNDYFQKELQHIGQQAVLNKEVNGHHSNPNGTFGYQDRYDEYRRSESQVHGWFRPGEYLGDWHFARDIPPTAVLNSDFVTSQPTDAPFQLQMVDETPAQTLYIAVKHQIVARRLLAAKGSSFIL